MEGAFDDPNGQLNSPFTLSCNSGRLADRDVVVSDEGEYNWMFAKGQSLQINMSYINQTVALKAYLLNIEKIWKQDTMNKTSISWNFTIPQSGHWRLELVSQGGGLATSLHIQAIAGTVSPFFGILSCINPGDLFRAD